MHPAAAGKLGARCYGGSGCLEQQDGRPFPPREHETGGVGMTPVFEQHANRLNLWRVSCELSKLKDPHKAVDAALAMLAPGSGAATYPAQLGGDTGPYPFHGGRQSQTVRGNHGGRVG